MPSAVRPTQRDHGITGGQRGAGGLDGLCVHRARLRHGIRGRFGGQGVWPAHAFNLVTWRTNTMHVPVE